MTKEEILKKKFPNIKDLGNETSNLIMEAMEQYAQEKESAIFKLRPSVAWFARQMEEKLKENDTKGGWSAMLASELLSLLKEGVMELAEEINNPLESKKIDIIKEAADVANLSMMIADRCGNNYGN